MKHDTKRPLTLALTFVLVVGGVAPVLFLGGAPVASAATASVDTTNDADSTTTSDWTDGGNVTYFEANASNSSWVEVSFDGALDGDAKIEVLDPETADKTDDMEVVYSNASAETTNASTNNYAWNITHDELAELPIEANENKTFTVKIYDTDDEANATTLDVHFEATGDRTVIQIYDSTVDDGDDVTVEAKHEYLGDYFDSYDTDTASIEKDDVAVDGNNTTTYVYFSNDSVATAYSDAVSDDAESDDWLPAMSLQIDGTYVPVFKEDAADWDYLDDHAYGVYDSDEDRVVIHPNGDEDFEDASNIDIASTGNEAMGFWNARSMFSDLGASQTTTITKSAAASPLTPV